MPLYAQTDDPNKLDTYADWKSINESGLQHVYVPEGSRVLFAQGKGEWNDGIFFWDGKEGGKVTGSNCAADLFKGTVPERGQAVTGDFQAMLFGENYYFYYDTEYYDCSANLTFGEQGEVTPLEVTAQQLIDSAATKAYDWAYVKIDGVVYYQNENNCNFASEDGTLNMSLLADYVGGTKYLEKLNYHKGDLTGILQHSHFDGSYSLVLIDTLNFTDKGMSDPTPVSYDATTENDIQTLERCAVTIKNMNIASGKYGLVTLPFNLDAAQVDAAFGEGAKVFTVQGYRCTETADSILFRSMAEKAIEPNKVYLVQPTKDITDAVFDSVNVVYPWVDKQTIEQANWEDEIQKEISLQGIYAPVATDSVDEGYALVDGEKLTMGALANAFSAYFVIETTSAKPVIVADGVVIDPSAVDGISSVSANGENADGKTFNLSGQRVVNATNLPAGVYIRNGKKIVIK